MTKTEETPVSSLDLLCAFQAHALRLFNTYRRPEDIPVMPAETITARYDRAVALRPWPASGPEALAPNLMNLAPVRQTVHTFLQETDTAHLPIRPCHVLLHRAGETVTARILFFHRRPADVMSRWAELLWQCGPTRQAASLFTTIDISEEPQTPVHTLAASDENPWWPVRALQTSDFAIGAQAFLQPNILDSIELILYRALYKNKRILKRWPALFHFQNLAPVELDGLEKQAVLTSTPNSIRQITLYGERFACPLQYDQSIPTNAAALAMFEQNPLQLALEDAPIALIAPGPDLAGQSFARAINLPPVALPADAPDPQQRLAQLLNEAEIVRLIEPAVADQIRQTMPAGTTLLRVSFQEISDERPCSPLVSDKPQDEDPDADQHNYNNGLCNRPITPLANSPRQPALFIARKMMYEPLQHFTELEDILSNLVTIILDERPDIDLNGQLTSDLILYVGPDLPRVAIHKLDAFDELCFLTYERLNSPS